jgi:hypothetical protein
VRLPAGGLKQFLGAGSAGSLQQCEDLRGFAALAGTGLGGLGFRPARGRFFPAGGLLTGLGLRCRHVGATCANAGLVVGSGCALAPGGETRGVLFANRRFHDVISLAVDGD